MTLLLWRAPRDHRGASRDSSRDGSDDHGNRRIMVRTRNAAEQAARNLFMGADDSRGQDKGRVNQLRFAQLAETGASTVVCSRARIAQS